MKIIFFTQLDKQISNYLYEIQKACIQIGLRWKKYVIFSKNIIILEFLNILIKKFGTMIDNILYKNRYQLFTVIIIILSTVRNYNIGVILYCFVVII